MVLLVLLGFRLMGNWVSVNEHREGDVLKVAGNAIIMDQKQSKCVYKIDKFWWEEDKKCRFSQMGRVVFVGKVDGGLIDKFFGRLWLVDGEILFVDELEQNECKVDTVLAGLREKIGSILNENLPKKEAALVAGIVLGYKESLNGAFYDALVSSGTIHIVVASGYNVMIVAGVAMCWLFWVCKRKYATVVGIILICLYALIASLSAPVVRAAIMASLLLWGQALGRRQTGWWSLLLAVWGMVMIDPLQLGSVSFQLSVAATAGLFFVSPMLDRRSKLIAVSGLGQTMGALITTLPIIWWHFGRFSLVSLWSNLLVLPLVPVVMGLGGMMIVGGVVWGPLAGVLSFPVYAITHLIVVLVQFFGV